MNAIVHQLLGLHCETPLHAGGSAKEAVIDLPIQKEAHTGWPCVYGSSMKGALRTQAEMQGMDTLLLTQAFGPDTENASEHAGALLVGDARLLLLPVRSLTSHFKWVTCPALLRRLLSDLARIGQSPAALTLPSVADGDALTVKAPPPSHADLYLEEFRFAARHWDDHTQAQGWLTLISSLLAPISGVDSAEQHAALEEQLTVVDNNSFSHLCQSALPVLPHIRINTATKTVAHGALWYEENLPAETLLYTVLSCQPSRKPEHAATAEALLQQVLDQLFAQPYLQIGGNETTGMGWVRVGRFPVASH